MAEINKEDQIVSYLKKHYKPEVILLVGSRARNDYTDGSDWDFYVYTKTKKQSEYTSFLGEHLDVSVEPASYLKNEIIKNSFLPIPPPYFKLLLDTTNGKFSKVIKRTLEAYKKGPLKLHKKEYADQCLTLTRLIDKITRYSHIPEVQSLYVGCFYEFSLQVYFESRNMWTPPPVQAFAYLKEKDEEMYSLLKKLWKSNGNTAKSISEKIFSIATGTTRE